MKLPGDAIMLSVPATEALIVAQKPVGVQPEPEVRGIGTTMDRPRPEVLFQVIAPRFSFRQRPGDLARTLDEWLRSNHVRGESGSTSVASELAHLSLRKALPPALRLRAFRRAISRRKNEIQNR
jgi:hypothetical protein